MRSDVRGEIISKLLTAASVEERLSDKNRIPTEPNLNSARGDSRPRSPRRAEVARTTLI